MIHLRASISIATLFAMVMLILHYFKPPPVPRRHSPGWSRTFREDHRYYPMPPDWGPAEDWELTRGPKPEFHRKHPRPAATQGDPQQ